MEEIMSKTHDTITAVEGSQVAATELELVRPKVTRDMKSALALLISG
jgi:hypothetical protein